MRMPRRFLLFVCVVCRRGAREDHAAGDYGSARQHSSLRLLRSEADGAWAGEDCGDTIQSTPLEYVHQRQIRGARGERADPMMLSMNVLGYDVMVVGNHELNYGLKNLRGDALRGAPAGTQ